MKRPAYLALALLLALVLAAVGPASGQALDGRPIQEIEFVGLRYLAEESLKFYLGIEEGQPLDLEQLNKNLHALWDRELVDDVRLEALSVEGGVRLVVTVVERPTLRSVEYEGLKRISRTDIIDRIAKDRIRVREGGALNLGELHRLKGAIEDLYREKGYRLAEAKFRIEPIDTDRRVIFTIDEGDKVRIADIDFEGNTVFGDRRLRFSMRKTKESGFLTKLLKKDIYKAATFEEDLDKVRKLYRRAGYKNVVIGDPRVEIQPLRPNAPTPEKEKRRLFLTIPIEEGARWKLGEISIDGNERFSDEVLLRQISKPRGGWLRANVIDEGVEAIGEVYRNTGHLFARVEPEIVEQPEQVADVVVRIDEGDQFRVGRIEFEGNVKTKDKVLRRELGIQEGLVLNQGALRNSLLRIKQLEFFKIDENDPVAFEFDTEDKKVDLSIRGEEGDRTELLFGGGFSEIDGFFGQFAFRSRNFLGRGETLGVSLQSGRRQDIFDLSYLVPWFLDRPQSAGIQVFSRSLDFTLLSGQSLRQKTEGGTLTYGRNLGLFRNISVSYSRFDTRDQRRQFTLGGDLIEQEFNREVSSLRLLFAVDRRDSRLQPTVGTRYTAGIEYTGGFLGGTSSYVRPTASFSMYKPVTKEGFRTVAAFNVEASYIRPFEGRELFFLDRFYLGGETSVRGFRFRSIWARDEEGRTIIDDFGFPLGGDRSLQVNLEYHFLLGGPFRLISFFDAGGVWIESQSVDLGTMRYSAGLELQVNVPLFGAPLRFIYSTNLDPFPDDRFETFQFSIGPSF